MPFLRTRDGAGVERTVELDRDSTVFGRAGTCDLILEANGISRRHGRILRDGEGRWWVEDLGSTNGTLVGGRFITRHRLVHGDVLTVGDLLLVFCDRDAGGGPATTTAVTISRADEEAHSTVEHAVGSMASMDSRRLTSLYEISRRLMDQRDVHGLIDVASSALLVALEAEVVVFGLTRDPERESDRLVVRSTVPNVGDVRISSSVLHRTIEARRAILVADTGSDDGLALAQSVVVGGIRSALCVPMMRNDQVTGFIYVDNRRRGRSYSESDLEFTCAVGAMVGTAIENARLHEAELVKQRMEAELAAARCVQQAILPSEWPCLPGWQIDGHLVTSREVGGDYYDAIVAGDGALWLLVADVCGKGAPAALLANSVHTAVHALVSQYTSPSALLTCLNELLLRRQVESSFVTCLAVRIVPATGEAQLTSAGHPFPAWIGPGHRAETIDMTPGLLLGIVDTARYTDTRWDFPESGGAMLLYSDGITEALNPADELFGEARLLDILSSCRGTGVGDLVTRVRTAVDAFRGECIQSDDLTLLACGKASSIAQ